MLVLLVAATGTVKPMPAQAAPPAAIPSQITLAIGGGAADGKTAMAFNWVADATVNTSEIVYSTSPDLAGGTTKSAAVATVNASTVTGSVPDNKLVNVKEVRTYRVVVQDLTPEAKYYYKVGNTINGYSTISSFTAPADPAARKPFSFLITPDTQGTSPSTYQNTADLYDYVKANHPDAAFLVHNGDVVEDASFSDHWQYFFDAAQNLSSTMPIMATPGNHDNSIYDKDSIQYTNRFNYTTLKRPSGLSEAAVGTVYSFEYGDALFISLNSFGLNSSDDDVQWKFLADETAASTKKWKVVNLHASPYDPGSSHYDVNNVIGKKFTDAGIDLVLAGHEHAYARTTLKTISSAAGTGSIQKAKFGEAPTYVIGGSVYNYAYSLNATKDTSWNDFFYDLRINKTNSGGGSIYSPGVYSRAEVTSNAIIYKTYYKATGSDKPFRVIDEFTITKSGNEITQPTGGGKVPASVTFMFDSFNEDTRKTEKDKYIARFNWVTPVTTKSTQLFYAKKSDFDSNGGKFTDFVLGTNFTVDLRSNIENLKYTGAGTQYSVDPVQSHKAQTAVLEPGTEYVYSVGDGVQNVTSVTAPASFKTPASNINTFNFNWISDAQANDTRGYAATLDSYNQMSKKALTQAFTDFPDAAFVLSSGDQVNFGFDTWEWDAFFEANQDLFSKVPLYMATGNHEFDGAGNSWANNSWAPVDPTLQNFLGRHNPPKNGASFYGGGEGTERMVSGMTKLQLESSNYYFVHGDTLFLVMDYQDQSTAAQIKAQQDWMKAVVKQNPTKWRVGMFHKTLFGYRMATPVASWTDAFDEAGIDVVLMGHDHIYARTKLLASGKVVAEYGDGTTYLTNYSANKDNRGPLYKENPAIAYIDIREVGRGFANISISPDQIRVTSKGFDKNDVLQTGDIDVLVTNKPRTYDLNAWNYPAVPQEVDEFTITNIAVNGLAKEGQTLNASITPASATASFKWESSKDGTSWTTIAGATAANYAIKAADIGTYLRAVATGTGFYNGVVTSTAIGKVTPLAGSGGSAKIKIKTASDLVALSQSFGTPEFPFDGNYELSADIDMTDVAFTSIGRDTVPKQFIGTFNGKGYIIRNLKISSTDTSTGFFAYIGTGGRVVNLNLANVDITGMNRTGIIAGVSSGTIENSYVDGKVTGTGYTGGIAGLLYAGTLQNTVMNANVSGTTVGGLIGGTNYNGSGWSLIQQTVGNVILNNDVRGTVTRIGETQYSGGIVGDMGGGSGSVLQTFNGNAISSEIIGTPTKLLAGYWSGSRPIVDSNQVNYYDSAKLNTSGIPSGTVPVFVVKSAADFAQQATYVALGWDFTDIWKWDAMNNVPVPRVLDLGGGSDKIKIKTPSDLVALSQNFGTPEYPYDGNYELSADIDMKDVEFAAIGGNDTSKPFIGTFNGKRYTISNLKISTNNSSTGFFAYIGNGGKVVNLKLSNVDITGGNSTGAIAGTSMGTIENSYVNGKVTGGSNTGGIVGTLHAATLLNSFVFADVSGTTVGGLIGGTGWNGAGSPIPVRYETSPTVILNNYVGGTFNKLGTYSGAMVGDMGGSAGNLLQTLNGNVVANAVNGPAPGSIAGYWSSSRPIVDSNKVNYYDGARLSTSGLPSVIIPAFALKSAADFAQQATFEALGWDFTNVWDWDATNNIPVPRVLDLGEEEEEEEDNFVTIIASAGAGGTISPTGNVLVERGQSQKFTFTPNNYYEVNTVTIDGVENAEAAAAREYTFNNVIAVHTIEITFKLSEGVSGKAPSVISTSAYYNKAAKKHIHVEVDFGNGALGIPMQDQQNAVESVKFKKLDGKLVLDAAASFWFPGSGYGLAENVLEICYDDLENKTDEYANLVPGNYLLEIIFADISNTVATIPVLVEDGEGGGGEGTISALTVAGGTVEVDGAAAGSSAQVEEGSTVKVAAAVPNGQRFVKWTATGLAYESNTTNPLTFTMPANPVSLTAEFENEPMTNADLSDLTVDGTTISGFNANTLSYTLNVPNVKTSVTVAATGSDSKATVAVAGGSNLVVGDNTITVTVTAEDGETMKVYTVIVKRGAAGLSTNAELSDLTVDGTTISGFNANTLSYTLNVPNVKTSVTVAATGSDSKATVAVAGGNSLVVGDNAVTVTVTAEDGTTTKVYTITVQRAAASTGGGGTTAPATDSKQTLPAGTGGTAQFEKNAVTIAVPAGASEKQLTITVEKVLQTSQLVTNNDILLSPVYEILKNFTENFSKPITITLTFDPATVGANQIASLFYYDEVKKVWVEIGGTASGNRITAEVDHFTKFAVFAVAKKEPEENTGAGATFSDVTGHWAEASIKKAAAKGIVDGYADGTFKPNGEITRAQFAVMLARALKLEGNGAELAFTDKESIGDWAKQGIAQAVKAGIVNGYSNGSFRPNAKISRAEMVTMIANAQGLTAKTNVATAFADHADIPAWAEAAVSATVEKGIVQGIGANKFAPNQTATRAEAAVILLRALELAGK
ncbi:putative phosphodiesterase [Paenibacillus castaneae]|uniref:S-layer homology domain-containing protein n=1 Tax=Paenibacillus castaneae TaxID=474957 RepID=UPI00141AFFD6|nr:S-layer homology domain-containing protein [Paenibacillus castaneae]NIK76332.1 putative phosphodiesterase [Paenibacillus castaneae]